MNLWLFCFPSVFPQNKVELMSVQHLNLFCSAAFRSYSKNLKYFVTFYNGSDNWFSFSTILISIDEKN